jgi:hypothetical protein
LFPPSINGVIDDFTFKYHNTGWTPAVRSIWLHERKIDKKERKRRGKRKRNETLAQEGARAQKWYGAFHRGATADVTWDIGSDSDEVVKVRLVAVVRLLTVAPCACHPPPWMGADH